jgi:hypothetical protein
MKPFISCLITVALCACVNHQKTQPLISVDVTKIYPVQEFILQEVAEIEYIPLETSDDYLVGFPRVLYMDDEEIFVSNRNGFFTFERKTGKAIRSFDRLGRGAQEYTVLRQLVYDKEKREVLVFTFDNKILVYNPEGIF